MRNQGLSRASKGTKIPSSLGVLCTLSLITAVQGGNLSDRENTGELTPSQGGQILPYGLVGLAPSVLAMVMLNSEPGRRTLSNPTFGPCTGLCLAVGSWAVWYLTHHLVIQPMGQLARMMGLTQLASMFYEGACHYWDVFQNTALQAVGLSSEEPPHVPHGPGQSGYGGSSGSSGGDPQAVEVDRHVRRRIVGKQVGSGDVPQPLHSRERTGKSRPETPQLCGACRTAVPSRHAANCPRRGDEAMPPSPNEGGGVALSPSAAARMADRITNDVARNTHQMASQEIREYPVCPLCVALIDTT